MRTIIFFFSALIYSAHGKCQDYLVYHDLINRAEYHIVNDNPDSAFTCYDSAFAAFNFVFPKDALIAAQFAWKKGNEGRTVVYLKKGSESGLRSSCLNDCPILKTFIDRPVFEKVFKSMRLGNEQYYSTVDVALRDEWQQRSDNLLMTRGEQGDFLSVALDNMEQLKRQLKTGKYPGERYLGVSDDCKALSNNSAYYSLANWECVVSELEKELWQAVKDGELHPREFGRLCEWEYVRAHRRSDMISQEMKLAILKDIVLFNVKEHEYFTVNRNCDKKKQRLRRFNLLLDHLNDISPEEINRNRAAYHITSLELDARKAQLQQTEGYIFFFDTK